MTTVETAVLIFPILGALAVLVPVALVHAWVGGDDVIILAIVLYLYEPVTGDYMSNAVVMAGAYMMAKTWVSA